VTRAPRLVRKGDIRAIAVTMSAANSVPCQRAMLVSAPGQSLLGPNICADGVVTAKKGLVAAVDDGEKVRRRRLCERHLRREMPGSIAELATIPRNFSNS